MLYYIKYMEQVQRQIVGEEDLRAILLPADQMNANEIYAAAQAEDRRYDAMPAGAKHLRNEVVSYTREGVEYIIAAAALPTVCPYAANLKARSLQALVEDQAVSTTDLNFMLLNGSGPQA
jgi:hypothetical protein